MMFFTIYTQGLLGTVERPTSVRVMVVLFIHYYLGNSTLFRRTFRKKSVALLNISMLHHPATILVYGDINEKMSYFFTREMQRFARHKSVLVRINSYGGELLPAIAMINVMKQHHGNIITLVDGYAASSASLIAASGTARFMFKTSFHLGHQVINDCPRNSPMFNNIINTIYNGVDLPEDIWLTARESFEYRLCDKII